MNLPHQSRRNFIRTAGIAGIGFLALRNFAFSSSTDAPSLPLALNNNGYGPLKRDPIGIMNLPEGFSYKIISKKGNQMADGLLVPGKPDGMASFPLDKDRIIIIRNHENSPFEYGESPFGTMNERFPSIDGSKLYDAGMGMQPCIGGTTTMIFNLKTQEVEKEWMSLAGTSRNCAGGPTPWGSWITCEETVERRSRIREQNHGFCFEVPASDKPGLVDPIPLKAMGRFNHEAIAVDPKTGIVYLTEDRPDGLFYRFIPNENGKLAKGGKLQVLALKEKTSLDTRNWSEFRKGKFPVGKGFEVEWIDVRNPLGPYDEIRYDGYYDGATRFARGEGIWFGDGELFFACTNGGHNRRGQIFKYTPSEFEGSTNEKEKGGQLELYIEPNNVDTLKSCDNLTISPWGDVVLCEDDPHPFILGINEAGEVYRLAENIGFPSEFAGVHFSPDGSTMFVNIQNVGMTLAITGPWKS